MRALLAVFATVLVAGGVFLFVFVPQNAKNYSDSPYLGTWAETHRLVAGTYIDPVENYDPNQSFEIYTLNADGSGVLEITCQHYIQTGEETAKRDGLVHYYHQKMGCTWKPVDGGLEIIDHGTTYTFTVNGNQATRNDTAGGKGPTVQTVFKHS